MGCKGCKDGVGRTGLTRLIEAGLTGLTGLTGAGLTRPHRELHCFAMHALAQARSVGRAGALGGPHPLLHCLAMQPQGRFAERVALLGLLGLVTSNSDLL